MYMEF